MLAAPPPVLIFFHFFFFFLLYTFVIAFTLYPLNLFQSNANNFLRLRPIIYFTWPDGIQLPWMLQFWTKLTFCDFSIANVSTAFFSCLPHLTIIQRNYFLLEEEERDLLCSIILKKEEREKRKREERPGWAGSLGQARGKAGARSRASQGKVSGAKRSRTSRTQTHRFGSSPVMNDELSLTN